MIQGTIKYYIYYIEQENGWRRETFQVGCGNIWCIWSGEGRNEVGKPGKRLLVPLSSWCGHMTTSQACDKMT